MLQQLLADDDAVRMYLASNLPAEESAATRRVKASFGQRSSVDFRHCLFREGHAEAASCYVLRSEQTGSRTLVSHNDLPDMTVAEFERIARSFNTDQETWWHFEVEAPAILSPSSSSVCRRDARPSTWRRRRKRNALHELN